MGACQSAAQTIRRSLRLREPQPAESEPAAVAKDNRGSFDPSTFDGTYKLLEILGETTQQPQILWPNPAAGTGAFSIVRAAVHKGTNEKVAVKIINKAGLPPDDEKDLKKEVRDNLHGPSAFMIFVRSIFCV